MPAPWSTGTPVGVGYRASGEGIYSGFRGAGPLFHCANALAYRQVGYSGDLTGVSC